MANLRSFIKDQLLYPLKRYPTVIQDAMIELITEKLEDLYSYTIRFPEIVSPNKNRLDILKAIADQFIFTVREDADLEEQIGILNNILYVYSKRGSIETIEHMWKYYGGTLPKEVKVVIPSYNLFRYSVSKLSGTHVIQDGKENRTGVYEIKLYNNTYPIPDLRKFLLEELVAAGNYIYFTNSLYMEVLKDSIGANSYKYDVSRKDDYVETNLFVSTIRSGFTLGKDKWSTYPPGSSVLSGRSHLLERHWIYKWLGKVDIKKYDPLEVILTQSIPMRVNSIATQVSYTHGVQLESLLYCTPSNNSVYILNNLYDENNNPDIDRTYEGYFILGDSLLS